MEEPLRELKNLNILEEERLRIYPDILNQKKKNNKIRLVIDYRELNICTKPIEIKFSAINEILASLN